MEDNATAIRFGKYRTTGLLGQGGMGVVFRAEHIETGEPVAIKTIFVPNQRQMASIRREIRALAGLSYPGIVRILDEGIQDNKPWYAMELLEGLPLDKFLLERIWSREHKLLDWTHASRNTLRTRQSSSLNSWWTAVLGTTVDTDSWADIIPDAQDRETQLPGMVPRKSEDAILTAGNGHLKELLTLLYRICLPLAYLHGEGFVHQDIKPSNILIGKDGYPVLMDFGLIFEFWGQSSRDVLEAYTSTGGTLLYISPEQISGDVVDARADLYSLGCIMYEMVTGQPPFKIHSVYQAVQAHLKYKPVPPSRLVEDIPPKLEELILNLLEKRPQDRIGHANGVAAVLKELGAENGSALPDIRVRGNLYRPRFFGRDAEIQKVTDVMEQLPLSRGNIVLIGGESGIGKTRFLQEIWRKGAHRKLLVLSGECQPHTSGESDADRTSRTPFGVLQAMFRSVVEQCRTEGEDFCKKIFGERGKILSQFFPVINTLEGLADYPDAPELLPDGARFRVLNSISRTLCKLAETKPILILLDDLQWLDAMTRDLLLFLARSGTLHSVPILIVGTFRKEEAEHTIPRILKLPRAVYIYLDRLDEAAMSRIVSDMLAQPSPPGQFMQFLERFAEGNPFFISEGLRICIDEKLLFRDARGRWQIAPEINKFTSGDASLPLPRNLIHLLDHRIRLLSEEALKLAGIAAAIGRKIDLMLLWNIVSFEENVLDTLDELLRCQILVEKTPGHLEFLHDIIQKLIYNRMESTERQALHRKIAGMMEKTMLEIADSDPAVLGHQWESAGNDAKAAWYYLKAARKAYSDYQPEESGVFYRKYLALIKDISIEKIRARNEYAKNVLRYRARSIDALREHRHAMMDARKIGDIRMEASSILGLTQHQVIMGNHRRAAVLLRKALEQFRACGDLQGVVKTLRRLGFIAMREGDFKQSGEVYEEALAICREQGDQVREASVLSNLGFLLHKQSRLDAALESHSRALSILRDLKRRHFEAREIKNLVAIYITKGDFDIAERMCGDALQMFDEMGDLNQLGQMYYFLGTIHYFQGELSDAMTFLEKSLKIRRDEGDRLSGAIIYSRMGDVSSVAKDYVSAKEYYQRAIKITEALNIAHYAIAPLIGLGRILRSADGNPDLAEKRILEAEALARRVGEKAFIGLCLCELGHIALARNQSPRTYWEQCHHLMIKESLNSNYELRNSFKELGRAMAEYEKQAPGGASPVMPSD